MRASFYGASRSSGCPSRSGVWTITYAKVGEGARAAHVAYRLACDADASYQDARYILPEGTTNYILCEYSLREFMNVYAYRGCSMFQWEIVSVMRMMRTALVGRYPFLDPYVKISCEKTKGGDSAETRTTTLWRRTAAEQSAPPTPSSLL
jgi:thymidylate synthase ThyX